MPPKLETFKRRNILKALSERKEGRSGGKRKTVRRQKAERDGKLKKQRGKKAKY